MCGITGFVGELSDGRKTLSLMSEAQAHRGPDGFGNVVGEQFGLAHCRLAIIDLSLRSSQPISSAYHALSYNGEIYNWEELRDKYSLPKESVSSDTLLLFHLLSLIGPEALVAQLRGIFAFSFIDIRAKKTYLVRDRFGTKPLYFYSVGNITFFASEIKAFCKTPGWQPTINKNALESYLTFQNNFSDETLFKNVKIVPSSTIMIFDHENPTRFKKVDINYETDDNFTLPENNDTLQELHRLLNRAVVRNLTSDVEIGSFLSGGIDSSILSKFAKDQLPNLKTFTIGFDMEDARNFEINFDETLTARTISDSIGTEHFEKIINSEDLATVIDRVSWAIEDPRVGQSYPNFFAAKLAASKVKVCLAGTGADEIFAGYPWRYLPVLSESDYKRQREVLFSFWHRLGNPSEIAGLLGKSTEIHLQESRYAFDLSLSKLLDPTDPVRLKNILKFEQSTFLHGLLLVEDKLAMSQGLEVRVPFLDDDLVNFANRLPSKFLFDGSQSKNLDERLLQNTLMKEYAKISGKLALRSIASNIVPQVAKLRKQGFSAPDASWFKNDKDKLVRTRVLDKNSLVWDYLKFDVGSSLVGDHQNGGVNRRLLIWSLLTLESTLRQFNF
jgi:asparagine synthase (glutamine-hydrolysing)